MKHLAIFLFFVTAPLAYANNGYDWPGKESNLIIVNCPHEKNGKIDKTPLSFTDSILRKVEKEIIGISTIIVLIIGLFFTERQLRFNYYWGRRLAAQDAVSNFLVKVGDTVDLEETFKYSEAKEAIPSEVLEDKFEDNDSLKLKLNHLLNFYEGLARGISQDIYDEKTIKAARRGAMMKVQKVFENHIISRQKINSKAYDDLESIVLKWKKEDNDGPKKGRLIDFWKNKT